MGFVGKIFTKIGSLFGKRAATEAAEATAEATASAATRQAAAGATRTAEQTMADAFVETAKTQGKMADALTGGKAKTGMLGRVGNTAKNGAAVLGVGTAGYLGVTALANSNAPGPVTVAYEGFLDRLGKEDLNWGTGSMIVAALAGLIGFFSGAGTWVIAALAAVGLAIGQPIIKTVFAKNPAPDVAGQPTPTRTAAASATDHSPDVEVPRTPKVAVGPNKAQPSVTI